VPHYRRGELWAQADRVTAGIGETVQLGGQFPTRFPQKKLSGLKNGRFQQAVAVAAEKLIQPVLQSQPMTPGFFGQVAHTLEPGDGIGGLNRLAVHNRNTVGVAKKGQKNKDDSNRLRRLGTVNIVHQPRR